MDTKQPEALRIAEWLEGVRGNTWPSYIPQEAAAELRRQHAEIETLRAGYSAARLEIASLKERVQQLGQLARDVNSRRVTELEAQLAAVGAGGVESLRKRECLHQITEPQAQPVAWAIFAENGNCRMWTQNKSHAEVAAKDTGLPLTGIFAAPQPAAPRNAPLYSPDDVAFPVQRSADGTDVPPELASTARPTSIAAVEVAAPSGPAREPLTDEQVEELLSEANRGFCIETEDYFKAFRDAEIAHGITAAKKGDQHGAE